MAEIISSERPEQIPYITEDVVSTATQAKSAADEFLNATNSHQNVPYIQALRNAIQSALPSVYPVKEGAPTGPYIDGLLKSRKDLQQIDEDIRAGKIPVASEDEDAATEAINLYQRFSMAFMFTLMQFEEGLSPEQKWT